MQSLDAPIVSKISIIALVVITLLCFRMGLALASSLVMFSLYNRDVFPVRSWAATDVTYPILFNVKYAKIVWYSVLMVLANVRTLLISSPSNQYVYFVKY